MTSSAVAVPRELWEERKSGPCLLYTSSQALLEEEDERVEMERTSVWRSLVQLQNRVGYGQQTPTLQRAA
jgi:hypothetical protein